MEYMHKCMNIVERRSGSNKTNIRGNTNVSIRYSCLAAVPSREKMVHTVTKALAKRSGGQFLIHVVAEIDRKETTLQQEIPHDTVRQHSENNTHHAKQHFTQDSSCTAIHAHKTGEHTQDRSQRSSALSSAYPCIPETGRTLVRRKWTRGRERAGEHKDERGIHLYKEI